MKLTLNLLERRKDDEARHWPAYMFGGRVRTSTLVLIVAFLALWWVYSEYRPQEQSHTGPASPQVVPPGFVPDPNYTWVPRSQVQQPATTVTTPTPTPTPTTTETTTPSPPPLLPPIVLPPPFGPPTSVTPPPGPGPVPAPPNPPPLLPGLP
jgi:hypothetical protein